MYDRQRLNQLFLDADRYFSDLETLRIQSVEDLRDKKTFFCAVSMILFSILNHAIDLGEEMVASKKLGVPSTYREIFQLLGKAGLLESKLEKELSLLVGYRNLFAHEYRDFDESDVFKVLGRVGSVRLFFDRMNLEISKEK